QSAAHDLRQLDADVLVRIEVAVVVLVYESDRLDGDLFVRRDQDGSDPGRRAIRRVPARDDELQIEFLTGLPTIFRGADTYPAGFDIQAVTDFPRAGFVEDPSAVHHDRTIEDEVEGL